ncbi:MAG: acyl carrier protein [Lachnospiraceae bacterium]|nr:acyl carrier protein [Lachnospiraceae bacterium]
MFEKVVSILLEFVETDMEKLSEESALIADLGLNSLDVMNLIVAFEEEFDIDIPDRMVKEFGTIGDVVRYLEEMEQFRVK